MRLFKKGDRVKVTFDNSSHIVLEDQKPGYAGVMLDHFTLSGIKGECRVNSAYLKLIVPEQLEPAKAPEQPELKDGMFVELKRYGIAKVVGSKDDLLLKIPGFMGLVGFDISMLRLPSPWTQEKLKADYRAARKRVWEESEAGKAARERERILSESLARGFLSSIKVVTSDAIPKGAFMFGVINPIVSGAEELKKKEMIAGLTAAERSERNLLILLKNSMTPITQRQFDRLKELSEKMRKAAGDPTKVEIIRFKEGDLLNIHGKSFVYEVLKDNGGEFIHVKNQITGIDKAVKRKDVSPILDARISDTGKVLNAKTADIYAKTEEAPASGADRLNAGKLQWSLVDFTALEPMVRVLMKGAQKYSPENWKKGLSYTSILDSTMRHMTAFKAGEDLDPETREPHTAHMLCNLMFLAWMELNRRDLDNRKPDLSK